MKKIKNLEEIHQLLNNINYSRKNDWTKQQDEDMLNYRDIMLYNCKDTSSMICKEMHLCKYRYSYLKHKFQILYKNKRKIAKERKNQQGQFGNQENQQLMKHNPTLSELLKAKVRWYGREQMMDETMSIHAQIKRSAFHIIFKLFGENVRTDFIFYSFVKKRLQMSVERQGILYQVSFLAYRKFPVLCEGVRIVRKN